MKYEMDFEKAYRLYLETFGDRFPMYQLGIGRTIEEVTEMIEKCLSSKKDTYEICYLPSPEDTDIMY